MESKAVKIINEMAFNRDKWIDRIRDNFLGGALGEYAKLYISREINKPDNWSNEVKALLDNVKAYMNPKIIKSKTKFDREAALQEATFEASTYQFQITNAKNEMIKYYPDDRKKILLLKITSQELMKSMLKEFPL